MDSSTFFTLAIGGIVIFVWGYDRIKALFRQPEATAATEAIAEAAAQATVEQPLGARVWLDYVNAQPDTVPHLFVVGPTRAGKTTLSRAIIGDRQGQLVIMTAKTKADWPGLPVIATRGGTTVDEATAMFQALHAELNRRMEASDRDRFTAGELTIVLDDYAALRIDCGEDVADDAVMRIARLGASIRMRLIVITDTTLVEAIGFKGLGEARNHFVSLYPTRKRTATIGIQSDTERGANGRLKETLVPIAMDHVMALAGRQINPRRCWQPPRDPDLELEALIGVEGVALQVGQNGRQNGHSSATLRYATTTTDSTPMLNSGATDLPDDDEAVMIRNLLHEGFSRNKIAKLLGGSMTTAYARIHRATGEKAVE